MNAAATGAGASAPMASRVLSEFLGSRDGAHERAGIQNEGKTASTADPVALKELFDIVVSPSGMPVNDRTAMQVSTVFACLSKLGGAVSQLPIEQYRMGEGGVRKPLDRDDMWWWMNESPDPTWTAASWKEWIVRCVALRGDQHTEILRNRRTGEIQGFKVHHPDYSQARRLNGRLVYDVMDFETGSLRTIDQDDMLHFTGFGFDGIRSLSMIQNGARNGIGNSLAAADYTGRSIGEGAMPQIALEYANAIKPDQAKLLRDSFVATYGGATGKGAQARKLPLILTEGGKVNQLSISPVDMELLGERQFEREDICQALGVPPVLIGDNSKTSSWGTGIEQITIGFVRFSVKPHLRRWQEEINRKIYRKAGPFAEFDLDELMSGDSKAQAAAFRSALGGPGTGDGYIAVNEVRRKKNLPPVPGGDLPFKADPKHPGSAKSSATDQEEKDEAQQADAAAA